MKSVGEVMAIGRTFKEALQKGFAPSTPGKRVGVAEDRAQDFSTQRLVTPHPGAHCLRAVCHSQGHTIKQIAKMTSIDPLVSLPAQRINEHAAALEKHPMESLPTRIACAEAAHGSRRVASPRLASDGKAARKKSATSQESTA